MISKISIFLLTAALVFAQDPIKWTKNVVSDSLRMAKKVYITDINADGYPDIVAAASNLSADTANVVWYENDGDLHFVDHRVSSTLFGARSVWAADITGNSYPDILAGAPGDTSLLLFKNDGTPGNDDNNWCSQNIGPMDSVIYSICAKDIDQDNDIDFAVTYYNIENNDGGDKIRLFYNNGMNADTVSYTVDTLVQDYESASTVFIDDINLDNEWDILSIAAGDASGTNNGRDISWWENNGAELYTQHTVSSSIPGPWYGETADVDNDGDPDIICAAWGSGQLLWWANDGMGGFGGSQTIVSDFTNARSIHGADIDGDGDTDILGTADDDNMVTWFENDGNQNFTRHNIAVDFLQAYFGTSSDMDGDGDMDIIASAQDDYEVTVWENNLAEDTLLSAGDPAPVSFNKDSLLIDYEAGFGGGVTTSFYNHGETLYPFQLEPGLQSIAAKGFYTITTNASAYRADLEFNYNLLQWRGLASNESDLRICFLDNSGKWTIAGETTQTINTLSKTITVSGLSVELHKYSAFTLGSVSISGLHNSEEQSLAEGGYILGQNYPNPFNQTTVFRVFLPQNTEMLDLSIYDLLGRKVKTIFSGALSAGTYTFRWDGTENRGRPAASGMYIYRLRFNNQVYQHKLMLAE